MRKDQQEELRRLEEALMEIEHTEDFPGIDTAEFWQDSDDMDFYGTDDVDVDIYNTDDTDVDLSTYSDEVYESDSERSIPVPVVMLGMVLLSALILLLLKMTGVL